MCKHIRARSSQCQANRAGNYGPGDCRGMTHSAGEVEKKP